MSSDFSPRQGAKTQESFVDFKFSQRSIGGKAPTDAEGGFDQRFLYSVFYRYHLSEYYPILSYRQIYQVILQISVVSTR